MKNHFFFSYCGNKREEVDRIYQQLNLTNKNIFVEPFCGSCAMSFYLSTKHPKQFKYIINDNNKFLIELFQLAKNKNKFDKFINSLNKKCFNKDGDFIDKETYINIIKEDTLQGYFIKYKWYTIRFGLYPVRKMSPIKEDCQFVNFLRSEDVTILNDDAINICNKYIDDKQAILFLDPPYINSCNGFYLSPNFNIYEYLFKIKDELIKKESFILLCLEDIWIIRLLFDNLKDHFIVYDKLYQMSKKKTSHIIIKNKV